MAAKVSSLTRETIHDLRCFSCLSIKSGSDRYLIQGAGISLSHEIRKRNMGGEQDFLKKGYQKNLKSMRHEVEKKCHWPEACIQADVSGQKYAYKQM